MSQAPIDPARAVRGVPPDIAAWIKSKGKAFDPSIIDATRDLYLALHQRLSRPAVEFHPDLAYGPDPRHRLDLHLPPLRSRTPWPVVMFFHGGGFVGGEKNVAGRLIHGNVADTFACNGMIGINATYRLAPTAKWPEAARDVGGALAWARANIGAYGGDPQRIFAMGQSAGATHVATYAFRGELQPAAGPGLAGVILMSGPYAVEAGKVSPNAQAYFGDDASRYPAMQVLGNIERADFPVYASVAEFDPAPFERSTLALLLQLFQLTGRAPRFKQLLGHNHVSAAYAFGTEDPTVGPDVLDFVRGVCAA